MERKHNLTIDDIARELGVSKTTVSRAISGKGRISPATRERIRAYIAACDYHPNAAAKSLAESKTYNLALVLPKSFISLDLPFVRHSMSAICEDAFLHKYNVLLCLCTYNRSDPLIQTLDDRKVDGVILSRTVENDGLIDVLTSRDIPFATMGSLPPDSHGKALIEADHDQVAGCCAFTKVMLQDRTEKTALLGNDLSYIVNQSRLSGFRKACQELSIPPEQTPIRIGLYDENGCRNAVDELLADGVRRFVCMDDDICAKVMRCLQQRGLAIPTDVQIASFSDSDALQQSSPPVSALHFDAAELGRRTCRELLRCLNGLPFDPAPMLGYEIVLRQSTL